MIKILKLALCSSLALAATATATQASDITNIVNADNGALVIERAGNFQVATSETSLLAQDRIFSINGTSANITLSGACVVTLPENQVISIVSTTSQNCTSMYKLNALTAGDLDAIGASNLQGQSSILIAIGAAAVIGGIIAIASGGGDDDNNVPTSP